MGDVLTALLRLGLADNTLVVISSDLDKFAARECEQGDREYGHIERKPYLDLKRWAYLEGRRIPLRVYGEALFPQYSESDKAEWVRKTTVPKAKEMLKIWSLQLLALQAKAEKNHS